MTQGQQVVCGGWGQRHMPAAGEVGASGSPGGEQAGMTSWAAVLLLSGGCRCPWLPACVAATNWPVDLSSWLACRRRSELRHIRCERVTEALMQANLHTSVQTCCVFAAHAHRRLPRQHITSPPHQALHPQPRSGAPARRRLPPRRAACQQPAAGPCTHRSRM